MFNSLTHTGVSLYIETYALWVNLGSKTSVCTSVCNPSKPGQYHFPPSGITPISGPGSKLFQLSIVNCHLPIANCPISKASICAIFLSNAILKKLALCIDTHRKRFFCRIFLFFICLPDGTHLTSLCVSGHSGDVWVSLREIPQTSPKFSLSNFLVFFDLISSNCRGRVPLHMLSFSRLSVATSIFSPSFFTLFETHPLAADNTAALTTWAV